LVTVAVNVSGNVFDLHASWLLGLSSKVIVSGIAAVPPFFFAVYMTAPGVELL
jgi:hypothetical protein